VYCFFGVIAGFFASLLFFQIGSSLLFLSSAFVAFLCFASWIMITLSPEFMRPEKGLPDWLGPFNFFVTLVGIALLMVGSFLSFF
jgi:hypothetical protein